MKVFDKALTHTVIPRQSFMETDNDGRYRVVSGRSNIIYDVRLKGSRIRECNCQCGYMSSAVCSHVLAAAIYAAKEKGYEVEGVVRGDERPEGKHFKLNYNTWLVVKENALLSA